MRQAGESPATASLSGAGSKAGGARDMASEQQLANRKRLIEALRAPQMPKGFTWDFGFFGARVGCGTVGCAVGLAKEIGLTSFVSLSKTADVVGLDYVDAAAVFSPREDIRYDDRHIARGYGVPWEQVTPQMVADKLEAA